MIVHDVEQLSDEWWELHRGRPTASRFDLILTPAKGEPSKSQERLIDTLLSELNDPDSMKKWRPSTKDQERGLELEKAARKMYTAFHRDHPYRPVPVGFITTDDGVYGCSPDSLLGDDGLLEIKCPRPHIQMRYLRGGALLPVDYRAQVHGQLIVAERRWCHFFSYSPPQDDFCVKVEWGEYTDKLKAELVVFREKLAEAKAKFCRTVEAA